jgi:hypothetical protein
MRVTARSARFSFVEDIDLRRRRICFMTLSEASPCVWLPLAHLLPLRISIGPMRQEVTQLNYLLVGLTPEG